MTWKIKIINISSKENDFNNIFVYFALYKQNPSTSEFEEFYKEQISVLVSDLKTKTKNQQEDFIKDFIKGVAQPLIDTFDVNLNLDGIIGYEEIL